MRKLSSLQTRYLTLIICAMLIIPFSFPLISLVTYIPALQFKADEITTYDGKQLEAMWHEHAGKLGGADDDEITTAIQTIGSDYEKAAVFWVDHAGVTKYHSDEAADIPARWQPEEIIRFMKNNYAGDPYTIVALIGESDEEGFMVFQIPRYMISAPIEQLEGYYSLLYFAGIIIVLLLFIFVSWLFFRKIRNRLLRLQQSMSIEGDDIPTPVTVGEKDEIGQLESSFNDMIHQLRESRKREKEEEKLRRELIANLSHDLRTPLSTLRAHTYSLSHEQLSAEGKTSLQVMDKKIEYLNNLIENLLSYTLLMAGKYNYTLQKTDINRILRASVATWYPIFEREQLEVDIQLAESSFSWDIDPHWLERILDNLFQNVVRHAKSGGFISIKSIQADDGTKIVIADKGPGIKKKSANAGAGLGLSIVEMMTKEMGLEWHLASTENGTTITIRKAETPFHSS
ncbi:Signal transduction histidine kinase [Evansella caseinilytica]|uniref:histidine kinase n=1 Tax=Evansella caseinilytica TaxID=1503961 RepID=A0A1H3UQ67_9BACI|nr:HAMP domain-containing sensor histidine kinase [Evansella caseinilytica]SDZ64497.1 Signal transduction histidine kinase [Evansella caseinilytica]